MKIAFPLPEQIPELAALWQTAFGDTEEFIDGFFFTGFSPARCRCITIDNTITAALYWFDIRHRGQRMAYIYAVATHPDHRGKGLCRQLMEDTHAHLTLRGYRGAVLVPQNDGLRRMYAGMGYRDFGGISEFVCSAGTEPVQLHRIDREEYASLRRRYLPEGGVIQEDENICFLETMAFFYTGPHFLLAAATEGQKLHSPELLGDVSAAPGILTALGCAEGTFRCPGDSMKFAMFRPLTIDAATPAYFGLAFD